jgi:hypothetical protein
MKMINHADEKEPSWEHEANFRMQKLQLERKDETPAENRFLKALHWMRCPQCGHALATERHGSIDLDLCTNCHGVWLDATALDAIAAPENDFLRFCLRRIRDRL